MKKCIEEKLRVLNKYSPELKTEKIREILNAGIWSIYGIINQPGPAYLLTQAYINLFPLTIRNLIEVILTAGATYLLYVFIIGSLNFAITAANTIAKLILPDGIVSLLKIISGGILLAGLLPVAIFLVTSMSLLFLSVAITGLIIYNYLLLVFYTIFAPILILPNVMPGSNAFSSWIKKVIGTLLVFPVTIAILMIAEYIMNDLPNRGGIFLRPLGLQFEHNTLPILIGFALIFSIPKIVARLRSMLGLDPTGFSSFNIFAPLSSLPALFTFKDVAKGYLMSNPFLEKIGEKTRLIGENDKILSKLEEALKARRQPTVAGKTKEILSEET